MCRLDNPTATLFGFDSTGMQHAVILAIASPVANALNKVRLCLHMSSGMCSRV